MRRAFLPNLCQHASPVQHFLRRQARTWSRGLNMGQEEREGFIISGSGGDMNFPFSLLACQFGLMKTELSTPVD